MRYPVTLGEDDNGTLEVSFPDFPEGHTFGDTKDEALSHAVDALATVIDAYMKDRRPIPAPSRTRGATVELPPLMVAKVELYTVMRAKRIRKTELARLLQWHLPQVDRVLDLHHASRFSHLQRALGVLGKEMVVQVVDRAR